jgi:dTDP-4-amino-4,6-dideoxygalactose transaminase
MILMNDFKAESEAIKEKELIAVRRVLDSGWYILGNEVKAFESAWAQTCGARHAIGVANGMDAIEVGLRALSIGPGDEVITTSMSAFATVLAIIRAGATPVLADIDADTGLLSTASVERCITKKTRAVLLVHLYGQIRKVDEWIQLCKKNRIFLLEDCAQSHLAQYKGQSAGTFGEWGAYSFYPTKNLGAIGDAGALITSRDEIASDSRILLNYGQSKRYHHTKLGMNSRLDEIQAALLSVRLEYLTIGTERRRNIANTYFNNIENQHVQLLARPVQRENHVYHLYVILSKHRDLLSAHLANQGIEALIHYPIPIHKQAPCSNLVTSPDGMIASETHASQCISLPCNPHLNDAQVNCIIEAVNSFNP